MLMKDAKDAKPARPSIKQIEDELKGLFGGIAVAMNECFYPNSGNHLLGIPDNQELWGAMDTVDLAKTNIGRYLPIYYAYAYDGRLIPGYENEIDDGANIERLSDFAVIFRSDGSYFDLCLDVSGLNVDTDVGHLRDMLQRLNARTCLDNGRPLSIGEIALLADMSERSVKNATSAEGENRLVQNDNGTVDNAEALRWLKGRRGFKATTKRPFPEGQTDCPDQLDGLEIPAFVRHRIELRFCTSMLDGVALLNAASPDTDNAFVEYPQAIKLAAKSAALPESVIQAAMQQPLRIQPEHCQGLAKVMAVDPVWFTLQVMRALYPLQIDMLLNPQHYSAEAANLTLEGNFVDALLNDAMIKHGYLDLPAHARTLFPADCFSSRSEHNEDGQVTLCYGGQKISTDIRIKSEQTISPRKRFVAWLQKDLSAKPGDRIRFTRLDERTFELTYLPK